MEAAGAGEAAEEAAGEAAAREAAAIAAAEEAAAIAVVMVQPNPYVPALKATFDWGATHRETPLGPLFKHCASAPIMAPHVKEDSGPMTSLKEMMLMRPFAFLVARAAIIP